MLIKCDDVLTEYNDVMYCPHIIKKNKENVNIKFNVHNTFLDKPLSDTLKVKIFESQMI